MDNKHTPDEATARGLKIPPTAPPSKRPQPVDPLLVTQSLGYQTFRRETRQPWTKEEDIILKGLLEAHQNSSPDLISWDIIAKSFEGRKPKDCRKRWSNSLDPNLRKGKWSPEEDEALLQAYQTWGTSWQKVSRTISGRTDDQCAKRYMEVLDPSTKDRLRPWSREEELELIKRVKHYGTKWRTISAEMTNRPSLTCRNRWRKIVTDVVKGKAEPVIVAEVNLINNGIGYQGGLDYGSQASASTPTLGATAMPSPSTAPSPSHPGPNHPSPSHVGSAISATSLMSPASPASPFPYLAAPTPASAKFRYASPPSNTRMASPPVNLPLASPSAVRPYSPRPVETRTEWKYSVHADATGTPIPQGFGDVSNLDTAAHLIGVAKTHGLSITIHQHIHHHYAPQANRNLLEPETQLNRYQHFNYLPPLAEVPKLNSSATSPIGSSGDSAKGQRQRLHPSLGAAPRTDLQKLLNNEPHRLPTDHRHKRAKPEFDRKTRLSHEAAYPDEGDESDLWEMMRSVTQVTQVQTAAMPSQIDSAAPVSQHHPLHYANNLDCYPYAPEDLDESDPYAMYYTAPGGAPEGVLNTFTPYNPS